MEQLAHFALADGGGVVVQLSQTGPVPAGLGALPVQAQMGFAEAAGKLKPIAQTLLQQLESLAADEVKLEFSVKFCAELGLILAKSGAEGHCRLELIWKKRR